MYVMAVDDEKMALEEFVDCCGEIEGIDSVRTFTNPLDALGYAATEHVDVAFLDIEMPMVKGIELAKRLKKITPNIRIVFVTGYGNYALEAFGVDAVDYVLKPYDTDMLRRAFEKAALIMDASVSSHIEIKTFGYFDVFVDGKPVVFTSSKSKELLAMLVDRRGGVVSTEQAIAVLWQGREYDEAVQSLFRKVLKSLRQTLESVGASELFIDNRNQRAVDISVFTCDYYDLLAKKPNSGKEYHGEYMAQYDWADTTRKQIEQIYKLFS